MNSILLLYTGLTHSPPLPVAQLSEAVLLILRSLHVFLYL